MFKSHGNNLVKYNVILKNKLKNIIIPIPTRNQNTSGGLLISSSYDVKSPKGEKNDGGEKSPMKHEFTISCFRVSDVISISPHEAEFLPSFHDNPSPLC